MRRERYRDYLLSFNKPDYYGEYRYPQLFGAMLLITYQFGNRGQ